MALSDSFFRHQCILKKLEKGPSSLQEIKDYYELECEINGYSFVFSNRNFLRDKNEILSIYKKDISYNASNKKYYLEEDDMPDDLGERIADAFGTYLALNLNDSVVNYVHLQKRRPRGMNHFDTLLHATKNKHIIEFTYEKYYDKNFSKRIVSPLGLKEFDNRWYLIANDLKDNVIKTFALDRIHELVETKRKAKSIQAFDVALYYQHCFGIIRPGDVDAKPQEIILSFAGEKGKFIKSLQLHQSQKIIKDTEQELIISLFLYITHDFVMEILSHGNYVKVISPHSLQKNIKQILQQTIKHYP